MDPREQGAEYANQGNRTQDPYLLRQAALAYRSGSDEVEAGRCLALADEYEGKFRDAGDRYGELGLHDEAFRCYWIARSWDELRGLAGRETALRSRIESLAADFMGRSTRLDKAFLLRVVDAASNPKWREEASSDNTWREVLAQLAERLSKTIGEDGIPWVGLLQAFQSFGSVGFAIDHRHLAMIAYGAKNFNRAVELWERSGNTNIEEYRRAKAEIVGFPDNLKWLSYVREHKKVLEQWRERRGELGDLSEVSEDVINVVVDAALGEGDLFLATTILELRPERERVARLLGLAKKKGDSEGVSKAAVLAGRALVRARSWKGAIRAAEAADFTDLVASGQGMECASIIGTSGQAKVLEAVVEELALSEDLTAEPAEQQTLVSDFLYKHFIARSSQGRAHGIAPEVIGAAIERAGRIVDALQYYEALGRVAKTEAQRKFAVERLIRNLEQHATYLRSRRDETQARQRQLRAEQLRKSANLGDRTLLTYPVVRVTGKHVGPTAWVRGPFKMVLSKSHSRLRIEHAQRFETVTVDGRSGILKGDAKFEALKCSSDELGAWEIDGWNMTVKLVRSGDDVRVVGQFGGEPFEIWL